MGHDAFWWVAKGLVPVVLGAWFVAVLYLDQQAFQDRVRDREESEDERHKR